VNQDQIDEALKQLDRSFAQLGSSFVKELLDCFSAVEMLVVLVLVTDEHARTQDRWGSASTSEFPSCFMLMHLAPGDPVVLLLGDDATPADVARVRHEWGLDQPLLVQYWQFISRALVGDFGKSLKFGEPVLKLVSERLPATIELATVSLLVAILISIPIGSIRRSRDTLLTTPERSRAHRRLCPTFGSASC
jgi:hypothetical protein